MTKIIIVEDELIPAQDLYNILTKNGYEVLDIINSGKVAMQKIVALKPDIVLMDILLKDKISGSEVALHLKQNAPQIAIVFLTAYADDEMLEYAIHSNCYGYLMKPYKQQEILSTLKITAARIQQEPKTIHASNILFINKNYYFDFKLNRLFENNKELALGLQALKLIRLLCTQANATISSEQISSYIWGKNVNPITLRTLIYRTKLKLKYPLIRNIKTLGYIIKTVS